MLSGKSILITGGTGSFGKKFIKFVLDNYPDVERVIVFSRDEFKQFQMLHMQEFRDNKKLRFFIGDVRDKDRLYRAFDGVDIVIHAAALKQVPFCEYNPFEAVKTNIIGAQNVIDASIDNNVKKVIALSTDKACIPINLYGATKLCSDKLFISGNVYTGSKDTRFSVVRYGNVLGSRGSVVPYFKNLINSGAKELPITDFRMTRFWLKLEHAVEMVITALEIMEGGELFVRKVPSMKVVDLAKVMAQNLELKKIGIRPGEKIHEVLLSSEEATKTYEFDKYYVALSSVSCEGGNCGDKKYRGASLIKDFFEYSSDNNSEWLSVDQMKTMINEI